MATATAAAVSTPALRFRSLSHIKSSACCFYCSAAASAGRLRVPARLDRLSSWAGLRPLAGAHHFAIIWKRQVKNCRCRGKAVYASLFGVGAPEALVIGVVALLIFGPKGLAEVARNLGKTLRAFQPTIRELQEVSRDFKSTLEREIGLDEKTYTNYKPTGYTQEYADPNGKPATSGGYSSEELLKVTQEQLAASAVAEQQSHATSPPGESKLSPESSLASESVDDVTSEPTDVPGSAPANSVETLQSEKGRAQT